VLRREVLRTVLPYDLDSRFCEQAELVDAHVLRRDDDRHTLACFFAQPLVALANGVR
jgi:hypothetical protein